MALFLSDVMTPQTQLANIVPWASERKNLQKKTEKNTKGWCCLGFVFFFLVGSLKLGGILKKIDATEDVGGSTVLTL